MATKKTMKKTPKAELVYAYTVYGGVLKSGISVIGVTPSHPESVFENLKKVYGDDIKGRFVKCTKDFEEVETEITEKLEEFNMNDLIYKQSVADIVKVLKEVTGATKCATMGIYKTEKTDKQANESESEVESEAEPEPVATKKTTKAVKKDAEAAPAKVKAEKPKVAEKKAEKPKAEKPKAEKTKGKKATAPLDESDDEVPVKKSNNTKIVVSDDEDDEDDEENN
jgi:hypothetical protein